MIVDDDIAEGISRAVERVGNGEGSGMLGGCDTITHGYSGPLALDGKRDQVQHLTPFPGLIVRPRD